MNGFMRNATLGLATLLMATTALVACSGDDADDNGSAGPGGKAGTSLPVAGSYVVDGGTETPQPIRVAVHGIRQIDGATVLDWSVTPLPNGTHKSGDPTGQEIDINIDGFENTQAVNLIDTKARKIYRPLANDDQAAGSLAVPWFMVDDDLTIGKTRLMQVAFPELPGDMDTATVSLRNLPLFSDVSVTPEGSVPTGEGTDLAAPAKELPVATDPQTFVYPVKNSLHEPAQKMSLVVNEVLSSAGGTSVVFTVTADEGGGGISVFSGKPIGDLAVVPYGTALYNLTAAGPGIRPSGDGRAPVTRAWFAGVTLMDEFPTGAAKGFTWRECLCSGTQGYGDRLAESGRSLTMTVQMPPLAAGTETVDVVFPDKSLPAVPNVKVTEVPPPTAGKSTKAEVGTWTYGTVAESSIPEGWSVKEWPTPVPAAESIEASDTVIDFLEDVATDDVTVERKEAKKVEVTLDSTVSFESDSAKLTAKAKSSIKHIAVAINKSAKSGTTLSIEGHVSGTDRGSKAVQEKLSTDRAKAVEAALRPLTTAKVTFAVDGKGATEPVAPNDSEENRRLNRRVVVTYEH